MPSLAAESSLRGFFLLLPDRPVPIPCCSLPTWAASRWGCLFRPWESSGRPSCFSEPLCNAKKTFQRELLSPLLLAAARSATGLGKLGFCGLQSTCVGRQLGTEAALMREGSGKKVLLQCGECYIIWITLDFCNYWGAVWPESFLGCNPECCHCRNYIEWVEGMQNKMSLALGGNRS